MVLRYHSSVDDHVLEGRRSQGDSHLTVFNLIFLELFVAEYDHRVLITSLTKKISSGSITNIRINS